jgi:hypothetical protein
MKWLRESRMRRAAKQYARRLGPHLQHAYGASEHYTQAQIRTAVSKLGLDSRFIAFGYAAFLPEAEYEAAASMAPLRIPFAEAHELFERFRPTRLAGSASFHESGIGMQGYNPNTGP